MHTDNKQNKDKKHANLASFFDKEQRYIEKYIHGNLNINNESKDTDKAEDATKLSIINSAFKKANSLKKDGHYLARNIFLTGVINILIAGYATGNKQWISTAKSLLSKRNN